jgi:UPF0042 nucleotide-binding protein
MSEPGSGGASAAPPHTFVIVTGLSGSGKSLVHRCFEDMGYFCVDNLPIELIPKFGEMRERSGEALGLVALTVDVREREFLDQFPAVYEDLKRRHPELRLLFLEADDDSLVKRFSETRRPHPLGGPGRTLLEGVALERERLSPLRERADVVLDTSDLTVHELRRHLFGRFGGGGDDDRLQVALISFGYRHGVPKHADIVLDARFLPNPYFDADLKPQSGRDEPVQRFLADRDEYRTFRGKLLDLLDFLLPAYRREGKSYLTIAIGCTGGRHRSVALVEDLADELARRGTPALRTHRDCDRQGS